MQYFKIIVEKHADGYVAYPIGLNGVVVGEGEGVTVGEALGDDVTLAVGVTESVGATVSEADGVVVDVLVWSCTELAVGSAVLV